MFRQATGVDITAVATDKISITLDELIGRYELANRADGKSEKTVNWYGDMLKSFLGHMEGKQSCPNLSCFNIEAARGYMLYLRGKPKFAGHPYTPEQNKLLSPKTVQCHVRALKAFSSWLHLDGYTSENRLKNLKLPKAPATIVEPLTPEETRVVIDSINENSPTGFRNHVILLTVLDTGLRVSEAAGIQLGHVNLDGGYIKVMGKGAKERIVPVGNVVKKALWRYISGARPEPVTNDCDNLFLSRAGQPITVNTVKLVFSRLAKASGIIRLHAHLCRHTFAINYLLNGGDIFTLQAILGHSTLEMVRHYLHFTSAQVTALHHKYSPMDKLHAKEEEASTESLVATVAAE